MQNNESNQQPQPRGQASALPRADGVYLVRSAFDYLHRSLSANVRAPGTPTIGRQKDDLRKWARDLGLLLTLEQLPETAVRGGQEHDLFHHAPSDRYFKITRHGIWPFTRHRTRAGFFLRRRPSFSSLGSHAIGIF